MDKKGITDVVLVLILSGVAIALIFIGVIYTYTSLAAYLCINPKLSSSLGGLGPHAGAFANAGVQLTVTKRITNQSECISLCCINSTPREECCTCGTNCEGNCTNACDNLCKQNSCVNACKKFCEGLNPNCESDCTNNCTKNNNNCNFVCTDMCKSYSSTICKMCNITCVYNYPDPAINYSIYTFNVKYLGTVPAKVKLEVTNKQTTSGITKLVYVNETPEELFSGGTYTFSKVFPMYPCDGGSDINASANISVTGAFPSSWGEHVNFCLSLPIKDVNIKVENVSWVDNNNVEANISITGGGVYELCPQAIAGFFVRRNGTGTTSEGELSEGELALLANDSTNCTFAVDTNMSKLEGNNWLEGFELRTKLVVNNIKEDLTNDEIISAKIDFSDFPLKDLLPKTCEGKFVVTKGDGTSLLKKRIVFSRTATYENYGERCSNIVIYFNWKKDKEGGDDGTWNQYEVKTFYVYSTIDGNYPDDSEDDLIEIGD